MKSENLNASIDETAFDGEKIVIIISPDCDSNNINEVQSTSSDSTANNSKLEVASDDSEQVKEELNELRNSKRVRFSTQIESTQFYEIQKNIHKEKHGKLSIFES